MIGNPNAMDGMSETKPKDTEAKQPGDEGEEDSAAAAPGNGTGAPQEGPEGEAPEGQGPEPGAREAAEGPEAAAARAEQAEAQLAALHDKYLRLQAEFENYKKRIHKEHAEALKYAQTPLLRDLIGIMDNLERALEHADQEPGDNAEAMRSGIEMVVRQLQGTFDKFGLERISAEGQPFDPTRHEAMTVVKTDAVPEDHVYQEFQPGYVLHERVVRPAMVSVAKPARSAEDGG